jgi:hypothetical protein
MPPGVKSFFKVKKRAAIELWKAGIPLKNIRDQLKISERGLKNILAYAKAHPEAPITGKSKNDIPNRPEFHQGDEEGAGKEPLHHRRVETLSATSLQGASGIDARFFKQI